jgi:hypothetical protein
MFLNTSLPTILIDIIYVLTSDKEIQFHTSAATSTSVIVCEQKCLYGGYDPLYSNQGPFIASTLRASRLNADTARYESRSVMFTMWWAPFLHSYTVPQTMEG